ncbi:hypothetical protein LO763_17885 [Glycomyces sp. A-F 0318]|uniref:hypothetical protein n=1 Tax=Glycomyces amatae TaxID=2881355 RepID=UPI001E598E54|nr:hypothetical protein [Glycomyces amatae]MCD0445486.1 hypothetical protein [Glycomyces amatae]
MVAKGKGKDYYKSTYTHEQLWDMLNEGDDWAVDQAGSIWTSAASGMKAAREEMSTYVVSLRTQWTGSAAEEFENRMGVVERYSIESEEGMKQVGEVTIPKLAGYLKTAQSNAQGSDLYPSSTETYDEWLESNDIDKTKPEYETKKTQYERQYEDYLDQRHEAIAQIVADLGDQYAWAREKDFSEPPPPPPSDMPGNSTYQKPTGGVFAENSLSSGADTPSSPGGSDSDSMSSGLTDQAGADGIVGTEDDLDPVDSVWAPGSYGDIDGDSGGLAEGGGSGVIPAGGGSGYTPSMGGGGGGSTITSGSGLFGPARGTGAGAGTAPGRGTGTGSGTSPARSGASSGSGSRSGAGSGNSSGRGSGMNSNRGSGMNPNRGGVNRGGSGGARGGTRSGYSDDDDETYTRETWLREDDVDWSRNRVRDEELDD